MHNDMNTGHILFAPRDAPIHTVVIIDFGHSIHLGIGDSDQEWDEIVEENGPDVRVFKHWLAWKGWGSES